MSTGEYRKIDASELADWIKKNPGGKYKVNGQEMTAPKGFFRTLLEDASRPFRSVGGMAHAMVKGSRDGDLLWMNEDEEKEFRENPWLYGGKQAVGLGSYFIPVAKGASLGKLALRGAMSGFASSKQGEELNSALTGGLFGLGGGVASKAFGKVGATLSKTSSLKKTTGKALKKGVSDNLVGQFGISGKVTKKLDGTDAVKESVGTFLSEAKKLKLPVDNRFDRSSTTKKILKSLTSDINKVTSDTKNIPFKQIQTPKLSGEQRLLVDMYGKVLEPTQAPKWSNEQLALLGKSGREYYKQMENVLKGKAVKGTVSAKDLLQTIRNLDKKAGGAPKLIGDVTSSDKIQALKLFRQKLRTVLSKEAPGTSRLLNKSAAIRDIAEDIHTKAAKGNSRIAFSIKGLPVSINLGATGTKIKDKASYAFANLPEKIPSVLGGIKKGVSSRINPNILKLASKIPETAITSTGAIAAPRVASSIDANSRLENEYSNVQNLINSSTGNQQLQNTRQDATLSDNNFEKGLRMALLQDLGAGRIKPSEMSAILNQFGLDMKEKPAESQDLANTLDTMASLYGIGTNKSLSIGDHNVGPLGWMSKGGRYIQKNTDQDYVNRLESYKRNAILAIGLLNKLRGAGVLNEGEYQTMMQSIPDENTTESVAKEWFDNAYRTLAKSGMSSNQNNNIPLYMQEAMERYGY